MSTGLPQSAPVDHGKSNRDDTYQAIAPTLSERRAEVFRLVIEAGPSGTTTDELSDLLGVTPNVISGRLTELKQAGLIRHSGERRATRSGNTAAVVVAVTASQSEAY